MALYRMRLLFLLITGLVLLSQAHAGDCWVAADENRGTGFGTPITDQRFAAFRAVLRKAGAAQQADPFINAIPNVRYQAHLYIGVPYHPGAPLSGQSSVYLHKPDMWSGKCGLRRGADIVHFVELAMNLNNLRALETQSISGDNLGDTRFFHEPRLDAMRDGYPVYENSDGNLVLVITAGKIPPLTPVAVGEYLDYWHRTMLAERKENSRDMQETADNQEWKAYIKELRKTDPKTAAELQKNMDDAARLASPDADPGGEWAELQRLRSSLTSAQRAQPVYITAEAVARYRFGYARANDEGASKLVKVNPALWAGKRNESGVRSVTLEVLVQDGESARQAGATRWLNEVDVRSYQGLLSGGSK
jgi:hypothetical protein